MEGLIGGIIIGAGATLLGPLLVSGVSKLLIPMGEEVVKVSGMAGGAVAGWVSHIGSGISGMFVSERQSDTSSSTDSEGYLERVEEIGKDIAVNLAEEEAATFIKMLLVAAL